MEVISSILKIDIKYIDKAHKLIVPSTGIDRLKYIHKLIETILLNYGLKISRLKHIL